MLKFSSGYKPLKIPMVSILLTVAIFVSCSSQAFAASGGLMGGSSFSSFASHSFSTYHPHITSSFSSKRSSSFHHRHSHDSSGGELYTASTSVGTGYNETVSGDVLPSWCLYLFLAIVIAIYLLIIFSSRMSKRDRNSPNVPKTCVVKLQVCLLGMARSFQKDLNQIAERADTSTQRGFKNILTESALSLIRHSQYWSSSHLYVSTENSVKKGEKLFSKLSYEERNKFDKETLVNLDNDVKKQEIKRLLDSEDLEMGHEYIVVTFLVSTLVILNLPSINNSSDLESVLVKLTTLFENEILAVQVLWTPQDEKDTLSSRRVLLDYPLLEPL